MFCGKIKGLDEGTEVLVMGTPQMRAKISIPSITVNGVIVPVLNELVGNLGAVFDPNMNMSAHVSKNIKSANYHLRNIGKIRKFLNTDTTKSAIVSLVTSRLDYCNGLLCGNTKNLLQIALTNLKRFGDRAFCAYAPRLWNELPDNIKAADSVQNFKKQLKTLLFRMEFNWPWQLSNDSKALLNIIGGKGATGELGYDGPL